MRGIPKLYYSDDHHCDACMHNKLTKYSFHSTLQYTTSWTIEILHMDQFGLVSNLSFGDKNYSLVIVNDYTKFIRVKFLKHNNDPYPKLKFFAIRIQRKIGYSISSIHYDDGGMFKNNASKSFCKDISTWT